MVTTVTNYLTETLERLAAMEKEALTDAGYLCDTKPFFFWQQEAFPYFTNRLGADDPTGITEGYQQDMEQEVYTVRVRLVIAHITQDVPGEPEGLLYDYIPLVNNFIRNHPWLQSTAFPTGMDILDPIGVSIESNTGLMIFNNAGFKSNQVGCEWALRVPFIIPIEQEY